MARYIVPEGPSARLASRRAHAVAPAESGRHPVLSVRLSVGARYIVPVHPETRATRRRGARFWRRTIPLARCCVFRSGEPGDFLVLRKNRGRTAHLKVAATKPFPATRRVSNDADWHQPAETRSRSQIVQRLLQRRYGHLAANPGVLMRAYPDDAAHARSLRRTLAACLTARRRCKTGRPHRRPAPASS